MTLRSALLLLLLAPGAAAAQENDPFPFLNQSHAAPVVEGDPASALAGWLRVLGDNPNDLNALEGAGRAALLCGDPSSSIGFWARADRLSPNDGAIKAGLATALVQAKQPKLALTYYDRAVALGVAEADIAGERGLAFDLTGNPKKAQADYRLALKARPDAEITRRLALSQAIGGDRAGALATLDPLLRKQDPAAWRDRAFVRAITGDVTGADQDAHAVLPPNQAAQIAPFLARLASLSHDQQASAVTFGDIPLSGRPTTTLDLARAAEAPLPRPATPAPTPATAAIARAGDGTDFAGRPLGARSASAAPLPSRAAAPVLTTAEANAASRRLVVARSAAQPPARAPAATPTTSSSSTTVQLTGPAAAPRTTPPAATSSREVPAPAPTTLALNTPPAVPASAAPSTAAATPPPSSLSAIVAGVGPDTPPSTPASVPEPASAPAAAPAPVLDADRLPLTATPEPAPLPPAPTASPASAPARPPLTHPPAAVVRSPAPELRAVPVARPAEHARPATRVASGTLGDEAAALGALIPTNSLAIVTPAEQGSRGNARSAPTTLALADQPRGPLATRSAGRASRDADGDAPAARPAKEGRGAPTRAGATADAAPRHAKNMTPPAPKKAAPERIWVQVAGGANKHDLPKAWAKLKQAAPDLYAGRSPSSVPYRFTNRLLVGPFKDADEAQAYVNRLTKGGQSGFIVKTPGGQAVDTVAGD